jgi:hypothetical protein
MKKITFLLLLAFTSVTALPQTYLFQAKKKGSGKWGYANLKGEMVIPQQFKISTKFCKSGTALAHNGNFVLIDRNGEILKTDVKKISAKMDFYTTKDGYGIHGVHSGLLVFKDGGKWGALGPDGKTVIPFIYDRLTDFDGGLALAEKKGKFFVVHKNGDEIPLEIEDVKEIKQFSEGFGIVEVKGDKWGYVDGKGKVVIAPQFGTVGYFSGGIAWARSQEGMVGYINKQGEWVIKPQFKTAKELDPESGMAMIETSEGWGYTDMEGNTYFFEETSKAFAFSDGLAIGRKDGKIGYLNNKGEWAIDPQFDTGHPFNDEYAVVELNGAWGVIDKEGQWVIEPSFTDIGDVVMLD